MRLSQTESILRQINGIMSLSRGLWQMLWRRLPDRSMQVTAGIEFWTQRFFVSLVLPWLPKHGWWTQSMVGSSGLESHPLGSQCKDPTSHVQWFFVSLAQAPLVREDCEGSSATENNGEWRRLSATSPAGIAI